MDLNKMMEHYASLMNNLNNSPFGPNGNFGNAGVSGGGGQRGGAGFFGAIFRAFRTKFFLVVGVVVVMQLLHYRSVGRIMQKYAGVAYETTKVHPYNHCIDVVSDRMIRSGLKVDIDGLDKLCGHLNVVGNPPAVGGGKKTGDKRSFGGGKQKVTPSADHSLPTGGVLEGSSCDAN